MKPRFVFASLALLLATFSLWAHFPCSWTDAQLQNNSDLIVIAMPIETKDIIGDISPVDGLQTLKFQGVKTTFKVISVTKGQIKTNQIVLHHYRDLQDTNGIADQNLLRFYEKVETKIFSGYEEARPGGPLFVRFIPNGTNEFSLYLKEDGSNQFAPVAGQMFSFNSIRLIGSQL